MNSPNRELPEPGEYGLGADGHWYGMTPNGHLAGLSAHTVTEHEDKSITVSPSILVGNNENRNLWHGYLVAGVWREC